MFPQDLASARLYNFWCGIREEAGLPGLRIHDCRHTWASQGVMNGVGLTTVGRLLGHLQRETTAIYAYLDDSALRDAAAQAAAVIARAMGYRADPAPQTAAKPIGRTLRIEESCRAIRLILPRRRALVEGGTGWTRQAVPENRSPS